MEQIKLFLEKAQSDSELAAKLEEMRVNDAGADELIAFAAEYGFTITKEELEQPPKVSGELSEEQLEDVAGAVNGRSGAAVTCWFQNDGIDTKEKKGWKCGNRSRCAYFKDKCRCFGKNNCQGGIHIINHPCG